MTLRSRVIRLAHDHPNLRSHLLPILKEAALSEDTIEDTLKDLLGLNQEVLRSVNEFDAFFKSASQKKGSAELLDLRNAYRKIQEGVRKAQGMVDSARDIVAMNPGDEDTQELLAKAEKVLAMLTVTLGKAKESFDLSMSGEMPVRLKGYVNRLEATLRRKVKPQQISVEYEHRGGDDEDYEATVIVQVPQEEKVHEGRKYVPTSVTVSINVRLQLKKVVFQVNGRDKYGRGGGGYAFSFDDAMKKFWNLYEDSRWV